MPSGQPPLPEEHHTELSAQETTFVLEYCKDKNLTRAGYAAKLGNSDNYFAVYHCARVLLKKPHIRVAVRRLLKRYEKQLEMDVPDCVKLLAEIARSDLGDYVADSETGELGVKEGVSKGALRAVKKVKLTRTERTDRKGEVKVEHRTEIELYDKVRAIEDIYKHLHGALPGESKGGSAEAAELVGGILRGLIGDENAKRIGEIGAGAEDASGAGEVRPAEGVADPPTFATD